MSTLRNWSGNVVFGTDRLHAPRTLDELQDLVAGSERIHALGTGHSFNRVADTSGELVTVRELRTELEIGDGVVTVSAGARYGEVAVALHEHGLALHNLGSLPHISVAGACATGTHGSGDGNACLAGAARGVEYVCADGQLVRVAAGDRDFPGSVLALGALGVVVRVTLAVEPTYDVAQEVWLDAPLDTVLDRYSEITASGYSVSLFSEPGTPGRMDKIWIKRRTEPAVDGWAWGARPAGEDVHPISGVDARAATRQRGEPGPWLERLPHFRLSFTPSSGDEVQSEFFVDRLDGPAAIEAVLRLDLDDVLQVAEFRTVAPDDLWLSPFSRPSAALHFTWHDDDEKVLRAVNAVQQALAPFDPRPHWGKVFSLDPVTVRGHYPRLADFRTLVDRDDPERKFANDFLATYIY